LSPFYSGRLGSPFIVFRKKNPAVSCLFRFEA
jgi:hypothetical protein